MKHEKTAALALLLLVACMVLSSCGRPPPRPRQGLRNEGPQRVQDQEEAQKSNAAMAAVYVVKDHAWLCSRRTDVFLVNRERTPQDEDFFDSRIAKGFITELGPGTRLRRRSGRIIYKNAGDRVYMRVVVVGGDYADKRGLVALDEVEEER